VAIFGHSVRETGRSSTHLVVSETATTWVALVFGGLAVLCLFLYRRVGGAVITGGFAVWSLYASVASEFIADRNTNELLVRRRIGPWSITRVYQADTIESVYVRETMKGNGLGLRFKSGHTKGLTMSLHWGPRLESVSAASNHFLYNPRRGSFR
jgi:hypothetical protein